MPQHDYRFAKVGHQDMPMLRGWLAQPHVRQWWGDPQTEIALMKQDLGQGPTDMRIVHADRPFAYIQDYPVHHWPMPQYADMPKGARAIDTFLGDTEYLGRGHAQAYLRQRARRLIENGAPMVAVDPDPANHKAIRAYRAAGFAGDSVLPSEDGDMVLVLTFAPSSD